MTTETTPMIESIVPPCAMPGGEVKIRGKGLKPAGLARPDVRFNDVFGNIVISADHMVIARVPDDAHSGPVVVKANGASSNSMGLKVALSVAEDLHPVTNPAIDTDGNIYATFSGTRGQKTPVSIYKIDTNYDSKPFLSDVVNATGIAFGRDGNLYVSSRLEGAVYRVLKNGSLSQYAGGMGIATGIAFDKEGFLYVGDRSGSIFKIRKDGETFVFATLEPSVSAYHLAFGPDGNLYVTGPTASSNDVVHRITPQGVTSHFFRGLGRPQGLAFDVDGNLFVAASHGSKRGIVRITPQGEASIAVSGQNLVGIAFAPGNATVLATHNTVHYLAMGVNGMRLWG